MTFQKNVFSLTVSWLLASANTLFLSPLCCWIQTEDCRVSKTANKRSNRSKIPKLYTGNVVVFREKPEESRHFSKKPTLTNQQETIVNKQSF